MYSFEGNFRRRPVQSLGGASKKEAKATLLQRTHDERKKREDVRKQNHCSTKIQAFFRACKVRQKVRGQQRQAFDLESQSLQKSPNQPFSADITRKLTRQLIFFFREQQDGQRLIWLCQWLMKHRDKVVAVAAEGGAAGGSSLHQLQRVLGLCCRHLRHIAASPSPLAVPMRMLEVFLGPAVYGPHQHVLAAVLRAVIRQGYFASLRCVLEARVPADLERSVTAPTPIATSIFDLIRQPLEIVSSSDKSLQNTVLCSLCEEFLCRPYSDQVREFVLPAMAYGSYTFPFVSLLDCLLPMCSQPSPRAPAPRERLPSRSLPPSAWLLYGVLHLGSKALGSLTSRQLEKYLQLLHWLVPCLHTAKADSDRAQPDSDSDDDEEERMDVSTESSSGLASVQAECFQLLNGTGHVRSLLAAAGAAPSAQAITTLATICHTLNFYHKLPVHKARLMYTLGYNPAFLRNLWRTAVTASVQTVTGSQSSLLQQLSRGLPLSEADLSVIVPLLSTFCALFTYSLTSLHDSEFYGESSGGPFTLAELVAMGAALRDACLGIVELAHPDSRPDLRPPDYRAAFQSMGAPAAQAVTHAELARQRNRWAYLFKVIVELVKQLYARDSRRPFCPPSHWLAPQLVSPAADEQSQLFRPNMFTWRQFGSLSMLNPNRMQIFEDEGCPPLSTKEVRQLAILQELPFVVPFAERVKIFHHLVRGDRSEQQGSEARLLMGGPAINIMVRRNFLYEDAYDKLSSDNEPNLKLRMKVHLVNFAGLDEAGIDGGGLFREFITELLKTAFDPNRGFFKYTTDKLLYPNPQAKAVAADFPKHYYFLGRVLGKALYENLLVELPFASFFLSKIRRGGDVNIHHLASLDPEMYKNLLFLKTYEGDVSDLGLDFTVTNDALGEVQVEELEPGGKDIPVTNDNRIKYIHLMADYRLNKQIRSHCTAFRNGLVDVVSLDWLRMFNQTELQVLISGAPVPIDLDDLRQHTHYSGGYTSEHPVIVAFWDVVNQFNDAQRRALLKFVTSCSRPPLLGFKDLYPAFCVHFGGNDLERLPSASTCMNLLKLPAFTQPDTLQEKLLYALESGAGFELS